MFTEHDERNGLVRVYWQDVRKRAAHVDRHLVELVDALSPGKDFPLYLAYYPYGALIGDTKSPFIPKPGGGSYRLSATEAPPLIMEELGYGHDSAPLGLVLEKELEFFLDLKEIGMTLPWCIYRPGTFMSFSRVLSRNQKHIYAPNGVLSSSSGARSVFMLPNISCQANHSNLQRDFNLKHPPPRSLYDHWGIFKEIAMSKAMDCSWRSCILFFPQRWVDTIHSDKAWSFLKLYCHERAWQAYEQDRNRIYYDIAFSVIQKKRNLRPNPYLADTARHLFSIALGEAPGYVPASNNDTCPWDTIQKAYVGSYGLKKYRPIVMHPTHFDFEADGLPIYYSLQHPSTQVFAPKSRRTSSTLYEMRELYHIMHIFTEELASQHSMCAGSIMGHIAKQVTFHYFHNEEDPHQTVRPSAEIASSDPRFSCAAAHNASLDQFAADAKFVRGCISIVGKQSTRVP